MRATKGPIEEVKEDFSMGTNSKTLKTLVDQIESGELVLPEIQRDFVWNRNNVLLLFDSLYRRLPIGYMLVWKAKTIVGSKRFKGPVKKRVGQAIDTFYGYLLDGGIWDIGTIEAYEKASSHIPHGLES